MTDEPGIAMCFEFDIVFRFDIIWHRLTFCRGLEVQHVAQLVEGISSLYSGEHDRLVGSEAVREATTGSQLKTHPAQFFLDLVIKISIRLSLFLLSHKCSSHLQAKNEPYN